jgi:hypothetical protein
MCTRSSLARSFFFKQSPPSAAPRGPYEIVPLLPRDDGVPLYRIKHKDENHERVAKKTGSRGTYRELPPFRPRTS